MAGKRKCKLLREIRQRIADENDIPFVTEECRYKGDCKGTCPKCESELRYLEEQLEKRRTLGKRVTVSALAAGMLVTAAGCRVQQTAGVPMESEGEVPYTDVLEGVMAETTTEDETTASSTEEPATMLSGFIAPEQTTTDEPETWELAGSIASSPEERGTNG